MKKTILTLMLTFLMANLIFAQGSYFRFSVGNAFSAGGRSLANIETFNSTPTGYTSSEKGVFGSYGAGLVLNASYGHMYSKNIGLDINLQYLSGKKYDGKYTNTNNGAQTSNETNTSYANGFLLSPALVFSLGEGKVRPYTKIGFSLGMLKVTGESTSVYLSAPVPNTTKQLMELSGGISLGLNGGVGLDFGASDKVNFFTEVMFMNMSYYPSEGEVKEYTVNGVDQPAQHHKITFVDEYTHSSSDPVNPTSDKAISTSMPLGNIAINVGIKVTLKKKAE